MRHELIFALILAAVLLAAVAVLHARDGQELPFHQWAQTPPMGWNSWDCFGPTVTEDEVKANTDYMAAHLKQAGWEYIVVDIRWYVENDKSHGYNEKDAVIVMDEYGRLNPAVNRFPSASGGKGFKPLADYVHGKGLKFGIHLMRGIPKLAVERNTPVLGTDVTAKDIYNTEQLCPWLGDMVTVDASKQGAQAYYNSVLDLYASWGIDFIKIDDLSRPYHQEEIELIRNAIDRCGRPVVLSTSPGETPIGSAEHVRTHANMWRIIDDFWDNWAQLSVHFSLFEKWIAYMGPGHWPDGDMLPLGHIGIRAERGDDRMSQFTRDEQITLMSLFLICRSPLMFGGHLPDNDAFTLQLITNEEALAVLQRSENNRQILNDGEKVVWAADDPESGDRYAALFFPSDLAPIQEDLALYSSPLITHRPGEQSTRIQVNIGNTDKLFLVVTDGGNGMHWDHADWIEPVLTGKKGSLRMTGLEWISATSGWETVKINRSVAGNRLIMDGKFYENGIGTHSASIIEYEIPEGYDTFSCLAGLDGECIGHPEGATVRFHVFTRYPTGFPPQDSIGVRLDFGQLGITGKCRIRDLWTRADIGEFTNEISVPVRKHGARLLRISEIE
ncbi:NPCBM/NEW2 domain-containing protein [bacterium]|nr:NPCBM/NEW2 domain-containing protein [bacterium]